MAVRSAKTQISLGICSVWSESSLSAWRKPGSLATNWAHNEDWSDWADAQADLSLRWAHMSFCWFCHVAARLLNWYSCQLRYSVAIKLLLLWLLVYFNRLKRLLYKWKSIASLAQQWYIKKKYIQYHCMGCIMIFKQSKNSNWVMLCFETMAQTEQIVLAICFAATKLSHLMTKPTKWLCAQRKLRSAWAFAQSDQSLRCALNGYM